MVRKCILLIAILLAAVVRLSAEEQTLKDRFGDKFLVGCAVNQWQSSGYEKGSVELIKKHYNSIVAENVMKSAVIHPEENRYDWTQADKFVQFGVDNGMFVVGHCLIWHSQLAPWFCVDRKGNPVSKSVLKKRMKDHIYTIMRRYRGRVKGWDVVNEAILEDGSYRQSPFYQILGEEFIPLAFQYAHEADPDAELYYNDYGMNVPGRRDAVVKMVKELKARGLRIDAIGMQSHMGMDYPNFDEFERAIEAFASTGCKVSFTEFDMSALPSRIHGANVSDKEAYKASMNPYTDGLPDDVSYVWNQRMRKVMDIALRHADDIERVCFWGVIDRDSWKNDWPMRGRTDYPLAFDRKYNMKPFLKELLSPKYAEFKQFSYSAPGAEEVPNPLLAGCYPDPSIVRVGADYYLVNSSFVYFPGLPIWHSTDLKNWERLGSVLTRQSQLQIPDSIKVSGGLYAPQIAYNKHNGLFYVINTNIGGGGNFYVTSKDPKSGEWSEPVWLPEVGGIDPSFLFDEDGKAYIVNNDIPDGEILYEGHRAIWGHEFDWRTGKVVGQAKQLVNKGVHPENSPIWIEGPHLYHIGDKYFLMCAEGGTSTDHSEVIFVSDSPLGEFKPCPINPILTQRDLDPTRSNPVTCSGHADLVEDTEGNWWAVFLAVRPYNSEGHDMMGRETFKLPVKWIEGQPVIQYPEQPIVAAAKKVDNAPLWNTQGLEKEAVMVRNPKEQIYEVTADGNLKVKATMTAIQHRKSPALIGRTLTENAFESSVNVSFDATAEQDIAGLVLFQDDDHNIVLGLSRNDAGNQCVKLVARNGQDVKEYTLPTDKTTDVNLKVISSGNGLYTFQADGQTVGEPISADILSTKTAGNFTGTIVGVYATSNYE